MTEISVTFESISPSAKIGRGVKIKAETLRIGDNVIIEDDTVIECRDVVIENDAFIGTSVDIKADRLYIGYKTRVSSKCILQGLQKRAAEITLGDYCYLGESSTVLMPTFIMGDYVTIHHHLLANGYKPCSIGHNSWVGQNCVLNSNDRLTIGNGVGIGAYSSIYTHAFYGELLEGCQVFNVAPVVIEDGVWIVGAYNVISPGVTIGSRSMILSSSVVSKSVPALHCVGGVPAKDLTDRLVPFCDVTLNEKYEMMRKFIGEFVAEVYPEEHEVIVDGFKVLPKEREPFRILIRESVCIDDFEIDEIALVYVKTNDLIMEGSKVSIFNLSTKQYTKRRTEPEFKLIKFMNSYRARFVPSTNPRVE